MSSSAGQESRVESQVARALEAAKDPFLRKIGIRFQKDPNQVLKISEILGFTNEEEKNAKALVWLKKHESAKYQAVLSASEAENKKPEVKMKGFFKKRRGKRVVLSTNDHAWFGGIVKKACKEYVEIQANDGNIIDVPYSGISRIYPQKD